MSALSAVTFDEELVVTAHGRERLCAELEELRTVQRAALTASTFSRYAWAPSVTG